MWPIKRIPLYMNIIQMLLIMDIFDKIYTFENVNPAYGKPTIFFATT